MSFNEMNTTEDALRDHLCGKPVTTTQPEMVVAEATAEYITGNRDLNWQYVHGENLVLYGKQPQDVFVDTCPACKNEGCPSGLNLAFSRFWKIASDALCSTDAQSRP